ncbi:VanZ family protein [Mobilitalea sibirica]|uniref:VanZ family protein n=1 Tax=Mobilitalea sibirica TaxID=1462919 RepID=A0A8J7L059_9FIRM|nr:VanZ family protein [Mobilitalea sibirica]MBH1941688.1 VanZ family protein [Mobilitalea sibirica]
MMQRRSYTGISSLIVFLSIITILVQFAAYYFFASVYLFLGISCLISIICIHILIEQSLTYESSFIYSVLTVFISLIITVLTYYGKDQSFIPYTIYLFGIVAVNWFIPTIHCFFRNMLDYGSRIEGFHHFYRNNSIILLLFYIGIMIYGYFTDGSFPWAYPYVVEDINFTPFMSVSSLIEDYLNDLIPIKDIITYLLSRILLYVPYGFYIILVLRRRSRILRALSLLFVPLALEVVQYFLFEARTDIDDVIFAVIGGIVGALWFHLTNQFFKAVSGKNFLAKESDFRYSNSSLHF